MIFRPSRAFRREADGKKCVACPNLLHFSDVLCISDDERTVFIHESCAQMLADRMEDEEIAQVISDRPAADDGTRHTLEEVESMFSETLDDVA